MLASEQATLNFYQWEYQYRGYYHFDTPIDIEVPYIPFRHSLYSDAPPIDDGRLPSLISQVKDLLSPSQQEEEQPEVTELVPQFLDFADVPSLIGIDIVFPQGTEILPRRNSDFLTMLSFTKYPLSFELVGTAQKISIQIICSEFDKERVQSQLKTYFPTAFIKSSHSIDFGFSPETIAIADFGLNEEYMRNIRVADSFSIDPLTSLIATMESLSNDDVAVVQTLFKGIRSPLAQDILYAVSDGSGGSFFADAPEMPQCAKDKVSSPLFSVVMRIATQGENDGRSQYLAQELARSMSIISQSAYNKLIPLSNEGYDYYFHRYNLHHRLSNRLGFILNTKELSTFVHYPNRTVVASKLGLPAHKTKGVPKEAINQQYALGINSHNGVEEIVGLNDEARLRHTHIIGATGVGKSTLIANLMIEDMKSGNGCALFDPHGDIVDDILMRIPEHRKDDVILIDPSDEEYAIGFNLLAASTEAEKMVLSSDLVSSFKRHATAWGDTMTSVLSNAINTFLESNREGTLIELKRFLLEEHFREEFLTSVTDPSILYYWNNEYAMVRKSIAPLLTRIDTFLRPKVIRYMLAQTKGLDFKEAIEQKRILLIKLSQGLIGEENSYLLGSLFLSKINQVAQGRQALAPSQRHPYYLYLDEFHNFITPSITGMLSGARKYSLGLILVHQELGQIDDSKVVNSVITNPYTRICFRLGDSDAHKLASGFSYFEQTDFQALRRGQAIIRIGSSSNDCNLSTYPLDRPESNAPEIKAYIQAKSRSIYGQAKKDIDELIFSLLPKPTHVTKSSKKEGVSETKANISETKKVSIEPEVSSIEEKQKQEYLKQASTQETLRKHRSLQNFIRTIAQQRGYRVSIEEELPNGKRVDIGLVKNDIRIAIEVSVTNSKSYEVQNIIKCIKHGYTLIYVISESEVHLNNIKKEAVQQLNRKEQQKVFYFKPNDLIQYLDLPIEEEPASAPARVKGWRIDVNYHPDDAQNMPNKSIVSKLKKLIKKK